jgi:hypothetical protein
MAKCGGLKDLMAKYFQTKDLRAVLCPISGANRAPVAKLLHLRRLCLNISKQRIYGQVTRDSALSAVLFPCFFPLSLSMANPAAFYGSFSL